MRNRKLRYYLRGLGIGILVTAFILSVAKKNTEELTDAQIKERALALGMVEGDSLVLSDLRKEEETQPSETLPTETETESEQTSEAESSEPETTEPESMEPESMEPESTQQTETITFTIASGTSSYTASRNLEAAGLIEDARAFDTYLCDSGYAKTLRVGTYEIVVGTSEEEIAKIITGKQ